MTTPKPHIRLNTQRQTEGQFTFRYATRFPGIIEDEEVSVTPDYTRMAQQFQTSLIRLRRDRIVRIESRNPLLNISQHIDYIRIQFQSQFDTTRYFTQYIESFGLEAISFSKLGTEGLFAVVDDRKVRTFIKSLETFIKNTLENEQGTDFDGKIKYIKDFDLLTSSAILQATESIDTLTFRLADFPLNNELFTTIWPSLAKYFADNNLFYSFAPDTHSVEVVGLKQEKLQEIVNNFDIVLSVVSNLSTIIEPSRFAIPKRSYGFTVEQPIGNIPIIGIIDTGISNQTPLANIMINDDSFDLTSTGAFNDTTNHGTGVAALAAFGKKPYSQNYRGNLIADARLLSIKILDAHRGGILHSEVLNTLRNVRFRYPEIKIFVLTIGSEFGKKNDQDNSIYAAELDRFSHENNCIIFICTANNNRAADDNSDYDIGYFNSEVANLCSPSESMNNVTVGAASDNITGNIGWAISDSSEYPALYTRKHHMNIRPYYPKNKNNKHFFKPDIIESGGDYESSSFFIAQGSRASIEILSSDPTESFFRQIGTSYSAPLVANLAARIQFLYPALRAQTIKALIINGAEYKMIQFPDIHKHLLHRVVGNGIVIPSKSLYSDENSVTFVIEHEAEPGKIKLYPIRLPNYLYDGTITKRTGILIITATLCFSFLPYIPNQLSYCPIHIGFSIFRNTTADAILNQYEQSKLRESWTQDAFHKAKPIPYSNSQKISFSVGRKELIDEEGTFKLAVNCKINPQILQGQETRYNTNHNFSLVLRIEEIATEANITGRLYDELVAINNIENIAVADIELEGTV